MTKENLVFGLGGMVAGIILGTLIVGFSTVPTQQTLSAKQQAGSAPQQQTGQVQMPEGHPPIDLQSLQKQLDEQKAILDRDPQNRHAIVSVANLSYDMKNYQQAVFYYVRALQNDPNNINLITDLGTSHFYLNNATKALELFGRSLSINPSHFQTLMNVGVVKMSIGDKLGAADAWERLLKAYPDSVEAEQLRQSIRQLREGA